MTPKKPPDAPSNPPPQIENEKEFLTILESVPNGIILTNLEGIILICNSETERMFRYERNELKGKNVDTLVPQRFQPNHATYRASFAKQPTKRQMGAGRDLAGIRKDGTEVPLEIGLNHFTRENNTYIIASLVDISERKAAEEKSREERRIQEEKFQNIVESVPNGILLVDQQGRISLSNSEAERMFGYDRKDLLNQSVEQLIPNRFRQNHPQHRASFTENPKRRQMGAGRDLAGLRKNGTEFPIEIGLNPVQTAEGAFVLASIVDISERKGIEKSLHQAYDQIRKKSDEMEQFIYSVSHDLKAPLVTSTAFIGFIREDLEAKRYDEVLDALGRLEKAHKRMQNLIQDLLQLSRIGLTALNVRTLSLRELFLDIAEAFSITQEKKVTIEIPQDLPTIQGDLKRVQQLFENLIGNAVKYASDVPNPKIQVICKTSNEEVMICIKDNGPGIDPQYHKKIFELFQRLDTTKEGTGVGLNIVFRVMQAHKGRVWLESQLGKGAEFWVAFPRTIEPHATEGAV